MTASPVMKLQDQKPVSIFRLYTKINALLSLTPFLLFFPSCCYTAPTAPVSTHSTLPPCTLIFTSPMHCPFLRRRRCFPYCIFAPFTSQTFLSDSVLWQTTVSFLGMDINTRPSDPSTTSSVKLPIPILHDKSVKTHSFLTWTNPAVRLHIHWCDMLILVVLVVETLPFYWN